MELDVEHLSAVGGSRRRLLKHVVIILIGVHPEVLPAVVIAVPANAEVVNRPAEMHEECFGVRVVEVNVVIHCSSSFSYRGTFPVSIYYHILEKKSTCFILRLQLVLDVEHLSFENAV